jgi:type I restriction enzyme S subunit
MIDGLRPYLAYKDSGVPWLGPVPEHWEMRRLGNSAEIRVGRGVAGKSPFPCLARLPVFVSALL